MLIVCAVTASAQDLIIKKDGKDIKAKVLEVNEGDVRYKLFDEPEGPGMMNEKTG